MAEEVRPNSIVRMLNRHLSLASKLHKGDNFLALEFLCLEHCFISADPLGVQMDIKTEDNYFETEAISFKTEDNCFKTEHKCYICTAIVKTKT
jgi:hypothetical protein